MALPTLSEIDAWLAAQGVDAPTESLWPAPYNVDTAEAAYGFCLNLRSWNEAEMAIQQFPDQQYLWEVAQEWHLQKSIGGTLLIEKCRRMFISWLCRGLELHALGLRRTDQLLAGEDYDASSKHVWRLGHLYDDLRKRKPDWRLQPAKTIQYEGPRKLKLFALANGSKCNLLNGESGNVQGDGAGMIVMEEFARYRYAAQMLAQAKIITQASANATGGFVCCITNTWPTHEWSLIKRGGKV